MPTTNYICTHGMVWGEISDSGVVKSYGHDALGSVTETFVNGALENTYRYKPYGGLLAKTGSGADPSFLWNGGSGYRATGLPNADYYVRRRHVSNVSNRWTTCDPVWPRVHPYAYCLGNPASFIDPTGLDITNPGGSAPDTGNGWNEAYARTHSKDAYFGVRGKIQLPMYCDTCDNRNRSFLTFYLAFTYGSGTVIDCGMSFTCPRGWKKIMNPGPGITHEQDNAGCPECIPGSQVSVALQYVGDSWKCTVGGTDLGFVDARSYHPVMLLPGPLPVQMAMGAGWDAAFREPQHTASTWSNMELMDASGSWSTWQPSVWTSSTTQQATFTLNSSKDIIGGYSVSAPFPLSAKLTNVFDPTPQTCVCPPGKGQQQTNNGVATLA